MSDIFGLHQEEGFSVLAELHGKRLVYGQAGAAAIGDPGEKLGQAASRFAGAIPKSTHQFHQPLLAEQATHLLKLTRGAAALCGGLEREYRSRHCGISPC